MPFAFVLIGLALVITSAQDTYVQLGKQLKADFTGKNSFLVWALAFMMVGVIGYVEKLRPISTAFMALILMVLLLRNGNFFQQLSKGFSTAPKKPTPAQAAQAPNTSGIAGTATSLAGDLTGIHLEKPLQDAVKLLGIEGGL
jgi:hypothetical protein